MFGLNQENTKLNKDRSQAGYLLNDFSPMKSNQFKLPFLFCFSVDDLVFLPEDFYKIWINYINTKKLLNPKGSSNILFLSFDK